MKRINAKKVFLICVMVCGWTTFAAADVVAYWPFLTNGLNDVSGNNHTLTAVGVKFNGGAAVLDGRQTFFNTAASLNLSGYSNVTMECFIKTTSASSTHMLLEISEAAPEPGGVMMLLNNGVAGQLDARYYTSYGKSYKDYTDTGSVANGAWRHIAMVVDRTTVDNNGRVRLYLDGQLQSSNMWNEVGSPVFRNGKLYIGSRGNGAAYSKFIGAIDDLRISDTALEPEQFLQERTVDSIEAIAYWPFNCGEERSDLTGKGNTLASTGVTFSNGVAVLKGSAVTMFNTAANLSLSSCTALTVEYFVKTKSKEKHFILEYGPVTYENPGTFYHAINNSSNGQISCSFKMQSDNSFDKTDWANNVSDGAWHHVAMVYDTAQGGADRVRLYLDGTLQSVAEQNGTSATTLRNEKLYLGSRANGATLPKYVGELDDIRITGAALTPEQFLQERTESEPAVIAYWPFDLEDARIDASGNRNTLASTGVAFRHGAAILDGTQNVFNTTSGLLLSPYAMLTVEYFVKTDSTNQHFVFELTPDINWYSVAFNSCINASGPGLVNSLIHGTAGFGGYRSDAAINVANGEWHHVAMVFDRDASGAAAAKLYLDGRVQTTAGDTWYGGTAPFQNGIFYIGSRNNGTARPKFVGELDDFRITGVALQPEQFLQERSVATPEVIAYWPFSLGSELEDASGNTNTLERGAGVTFRSRAAMLDGSQTLFNTISNLKLSPYSALTVEYFVKTDSPVEAMILETAEKYWYYSGTFCSMINSGSVQGRIFSKFALGSAYGLAKYNEDRSDTNGVHVINASDGNWHHVSMVYNPYKDGADRVVLYVDKIAQNSAIVNDDLATTFKDKIFYIGFRREGYELKFTGALDDIRITGAALEPDEFMQVRSSELPSELGTLITIQ